jgi:ABC-type amino acid transport substrate-binding protein
VSLIRIAVVVLALLTLQSPRAGAAEALRLCVDQDAAPFSFKRGTRTGGFDLALAQAIADRIGRDLSIQWFESEDQPEKGKETKTGVAALLADKRCNLAGAYPLFEASLAGPLRTDARLPRYPGRTIEERRRAIALDELLGSTPYIYTAPAVVLGPRVAGKTIASLADLDGVRIGAEQSSFPDMILTVYQDGRLLPQVTHIAPSRGLLERLEAGDYDAVLVDIHRFDGYRNEHPETALRLSGFLHPAGFNLGFVGLARDPELMRAVNAALDALTKDGTVESLAKKAGVTYLPPRAPAVRPTPTLVDLSKG